MSFWICTLWDWVAVKLWILSLLRLILQNVHKFNQINYIIIDWESFQHCISFIWSPYMHICGLGNEFYLLHLAINCIKYMCYRNEASLSETYLCFIFHSLFHLCMCVCVCYVTYVVRLKISHLTLLKAEHKQLLRFYMVYSIRKTRQPKNFYWMFNVFMAHYYIVSTLKACFRFVSFK